MSPNSAEMQAQGYPVLPVRHSGEEQWVALDGQTFFQEP